MPLSRQSQSWVKYAWIVITAVVSYSIYEEVLEASTEDTSIKPLVKRFADQRKLSLVVFTAVLAFNVHEGRMTAIRVIVALILLTVNTSFVYDGISDDAFKAHIDALGPAAFTLLNSLPRFMARITLWVEIFCGFESKVAATGVALLMSMPGLLPVAGSIVAKWTAAGLAGEDTGTSDIPSDVSVEEVV